MKKTKISCLFAAVISACLMSFTACQNEDENIGVDNLVTIKLSVDELFQEKAHIRVRHDGASDQFWFYFLTPDLESDARELIEEEMQQTLDFYGEIIGNLGVNKSVTFDNLSARTNYRAIAAAISPTGEVCSNIAELVFCTKRDPAIFEVNENWNISYSKRAASETDPDVETEYFTVSSTDSLTYYPFVVLKSDFENTYGNDVRSCFESYVDFRNSENIKWSKVVMVADGVHTEDRLRSNVYLAFMMGIDAEGELTGYYALNEIDIKQETPTDEYAAWLGEWTVSGTDYDNNPKSYDIRIEADENNLYYKMYGWEGDITDGYYSEVPHTFPITLYFEKATGNAYVVSGFIGEPLEDVLFYIYGNADISGSITAINIDNRKVARFENVNGVPHLLPEEYAVYDYAGNYLKGKYVSFSYCYTLRGYEYVGWAPFTADNKVPELLGIKIEKK